MSEQPASPTSPAPDRPDYGLVEDAANDAVHAVLSDVAAQLEAGELSRVEAVVLLADGMSEIARTYPDVLDATTRTQIMQALDPVLDRAGFERLTPWEW